MNEIYKDIIQKYNSKINELREEFEEESSKLINEEEKKQGLEKILKKEVSSITLALDYQFYDFAFVIGIQASEENFTVLFISSVNGCIYIYSVEETKKILSKVVTKSKVKQILKLLKIEGEIQYELCQNNK